MNALSGIRYGAELTSAAQRYHLDPTLLAAVAAQETGGPGQNSGNNIVGDGGHGHGLMQIDDRWHSFASTPAAMDPQSNANYAAGLLSNLLQQYGGNVKEALSAYNAGSPTATGTTTDWGDGKPLGYADSVMQHYQQIASLEAGQGGSGAAGAVPAVSTGAGAAPAGGNPGSLDPLSAIEALQTSALPAAGSEAGAGSFGELGSLLGDAAAATYGASSGSGASAASSTGGSSSSSDSSADAAALIQQMGEDGQQSQSTTPPYINWSQLTNASTQVSGQADLLMADLGDPADGAAPAES